MFHPRMILDDNWHIVIIYYYYYYTISIIIAAKQKQLLLLANVFFSARKGTRATWQVLPYCDSKLEKGK